jgi:hypothetical protein
MIGALATACATSFPCGPHARCDVATEYCQTTTGGAISEAGAPAPHDCPDFTPASGCGCSKDWLTGAVHIGCNLP